MNAQQTLDYLKAYAEHFGLYQHIKLNTRVSQVVRTAENKKWQLQLLQQAGEKAVEKTLEFDKVVFCTGENNRPRIPAVIWMELCKGKIIHAQAFKRSVL